MLLFPLNHILGRNGKNFVGIGEGGLTVVELLPFWKKGSQFAVSHSPTEETIEGQKEPPFSEQDEIADSNKGGDGGSKEEEPETVGEEEDYKSKYYYLAAEMENMRKRFGRERENFVKYGNEKILTDLIEVVDNLDRTLESLSEGKDKKVDNIVVGIGMVHKQFLRVLKQNGLEMVETDGKMFDPNYHEAVGQQVSEDREENEILSVCQKGYVLQGRLLRAAKVMIAKKK